MGLSTGQGSTKLYKDLILIPYKYLIVTLMSSHTYFFSYTYLLSVLALCNPKYTLSCWRVQGGGAGGMGNGMD